MELMEIVQSSTLEKIKELISSDRIPSKCKWLDYTLLNAALVNKRNDVAKYFLGENFRVNKTGRSVIPEKTPLHHAVKLEDMELLNTLLLKKASIVAVNDEGDTPLHVAFMNRNNPAVDAMLLTIQSTKISNPKNQRGLSHFHIACTRNNEKAVIHYLNSGVDIADTVSTNSLLWPGYTALHFAVEYQSLGVVKLLLDDKTDIFSQNKKQLKPMAVSNFNQASLIYYFLMDQNQYILNNKITNFHVACMKEDSGLVKNFLENGAAVNTAVSDECVFCPLYTPLHFAVESNQKENVDLLLLYGAKFYKNGYYMTPLHLALYNENHDEKNTIVDLLYSKVKVKEQDCQDLNGLTYFHIACTRNDTNVVLKFLNHGEDVNAQILWNLRNFSQFTPLHFAAQYNCLETAELLIKNGAEVNRSDFGMHGTPLHIAFQNGNDSMIELLLKNGGQVDIIRPYDDKTMLHIFVEEMMNQSRRDENPMKVIDNLTNRETRAELYIQKLIKLGCQIDAKDTDGNTALHIASSKLTNGILMAEILLRLGADINIENNEGDTPFCCTFFNTYQGNAENYMTFYHHVQKLKDLGIKVNRKNEECCVKLLNEKKDCDPDACCFEEKNIIREHEKRLAEIEKMKKIKLDENTSLYKILFEDVKNLSLICKNTGIKEIIEANDFSALYPCYGDMLKVKYQKGKDNLSLSTFEKMMTVEDTEKPRPKRKRR